MRSRSLAALALALTAGACGGGSAEPPAPAPTEPPATAPATESPPADTAPPAADGASAAIISVTVDPGDGTILVGTGPALFRVPAGETEGKPMTGRISTPQGDGTVSGNLVTKFAGPGVLLGSGHPQSEGTLPENLGLIRSRDHGDTWEPVSGLGEGDYHELEIAGDQILAVNVESPDILVSRDGGATWEKRAPPAAPIDVVVDPSDPQRWAVSTEQGTFVSTNGGGSWRPRDTSFGARLAWPAKDALYSVDRNGKVRVSPDGGGSWRDRGDVGGTPTDITSGPKDELLVGIIGGKVRKSADGGSKWTTAATLR